MGVRGREGVRQAAHHRGQARQGGCGGAWLQEVVAAQQGQLQVAAAHSESGRDRGQEETHSRPHWSSGGEGASEAVLCGGHYSTCSGGGRGRGSHAGQQLGDGPHLVKPIAACLLRGSGNVPAREASCWGGGQAISEAQT